MVHTINAKKDTIKMLHTKIVDQGEMCYEMLGEVLEHKRSAQLMKKHADEASQLSIARQHKKDAATETVRSLKDQLTLMEDRLQREQYRNNKNKRRIRDLE